MIAWASLNGLNVSARTFQVDEPSMRREYIKNPMDGRRVLAPFTPPPFSAQETIANNAFFSGGANTSAQERLPQLRAQQVDVNQLRQALGNTPPSVPTRGQARLADAGPQNAKTIEVTRQNQGNVSQEGLGGPPSTSAILGFIAPSVKDSPPTSRLPNIPVGIGLSGLQPDIDTILSSYKVDEGTLPQSMSGKDYGKTPAAWA